jgi:aldehyde:ferredoxin oxidoreductase
VGALAGHAAQLRAEGTPGIYDICCRIDDAPARNWAGVAEIDSPNYEDCRGANVIAKQKRRYGCWRCPIACGGIMKAGTGEYIYEEGAHKPEYETMAMFGSNLCNDNLDSLIVASDVCNRLGMDTISAGVSIAFAMECYEKGFLTKDQMDGIDAKFGNPAAMLALLEKVAHREGIGDLLAEGSLRAARKIGHDSEDFAMQVKGQEIPMHEPRLKMGLGIGYALSPTGADHCHNIHDTGYVKGSKSAMAYGILDPLPADDLGPRKVRLLAYMLSRRQFGNCLGICDFVEWNDDDVVAMVRAATGWNCNLWELVKTGERAMTLARLFNLREGFYRQGRCASQALPRGLCHRTPYRGRAHVRAGREGQKGLLRDDGLEQGFRSPDQSQGSGTRHRVGSRRGGRRVAGRARHRTD